MRYDYRCPDCKQIVERTCLVRERDLQLCHCGAPLERVFTPSVQIRIPTYMRAGASDFNEGESIFPTSTESQKTWDECDVRPKTGGRWL